MQKKLIISLLLLLFVFFAGTQVSAAENPDPDRPCSVTFVLDFNGKPLEGGSLTLYRVGEVNFASDNFSLVEPLSNEGIRLDDLQNPALAKELYNLAVEYNLKPFRSPVKGGKAVFADLQSGLYVVSQQKDEESPGYAPINPFLISMPQWLDDTYIYDLTASPKVPLVPEITEPTEPFIPTEPHDIPDLPQTGQLRWPIPLMAVSGLTIFGIGWNLFFGSKRRGV